MPVKYGKFEMPKDIKLDETTQSATFGRFVIEPFEPGFAHTLGNAFRRIMLTSLEAPAIVSVKIEGVSHEYMAVEGIVQDMTHVILNFKTALLRHLTQGEDANPREVRTLIKSLEVTDEMIEKGGGNYCVTLSDLIEDPTLEVVNPDHHIFTVTKPMVRRVELKIGMGRGYVPSERQIFVEPGVDEIVIDAAYSPVRIVNYYVENTRVGQDTDYDRLILEVTTDGRVSPIEALTFSAQIGIHHFNIFDTVKTHSIVFDTGELHTNRDRDEVLQKLALRIDEIELSVRSTNCLANADIATIGELVVMPEGDMLRFRNFGKKSLTEIKQKLDELGLCLGMDLSKYGINRDNIKEIIDTYMQEKAGAVEA